MHSHASMTKKSLSILEPIDISPGACYDIYNTPIYMTHYRHRIMNLRINGTTYTRLTELGSISDDSKCHGISFTTDGTAYIDSILRSHYSISIKRYPAIYHHSHCNVKFYEGTICAYKHGNCYIQESIVATWIVAMKRSNCGNSIYTVLYEGNSNSITF